MAPAVVPPTARERACSEEHRAGGAPVRTAALAERDESRKLLEDELAKRVYQEAQPSFFERAVQAAIDWVVDALSGVRSLGAGPGTLLLAAGAVLLIVVAVLLVRPRLNARAARKSLSVFGGGSILSAEAHRRRAVAAAGAGRWNEALAERLRALIRDAEERGVLEDRPGRTATEAAAGLAQAFGDQAGEIAWLAERFNEVQYGGGTADEADGARASSLDSVLAAALPAHSSASAASAGPAVPR